MVEAGDAKILFDPLFQPGLRPVMNDEFAETIIDGLAPYEGVDAVFISHAHRDHFHADYIIRLLAAQKDLRLFVPTQVAAMLEAHPDWKLEFDERVKSVDLAPGHSLRYTLGSMRIDAVRVPHIGYPNRNAGLENIVFRVALTPNHRVMHLGDADGQPDHFAPHEAMFSEARTGMAFVPYWMLLEDSGREVIGTMLNAEKVIGIHVGTRANPEDASAELIASGEDYFSKLGETRVIPETSGPEQE
ncbi:MBL fold metallo-hydrolase [Altererythrobacter sp. JGD-16]|uniref:MBL fold metallo-hydrolase n=2 Tax=Altererythrobacter lutimaris TaxID=2743979 RepID=A0A850HEH9_9SPHN|nr:MBL fold metallo-hydrolase [Altererythrobacter lutimaris]